MTAPLIPVVELRPNGPLHLLRTKGDWLVDWLPTKCGLGVGPLDLVFDVDSSDADFCKRCLKVKNYS